MQIQAVIDENLTYQKVNTKETEIKITFTSFMSISDFNKLMEKSDEGCVLLELGE